jgi:hypothetical protein
MISAGKFVKTLGSARPNQVYHNSNDSTLAGLPDF